MQTSDSRSEHTRRPSPLGQLLYAPVVKKMNEPMLVFKWKILSTCLRKAFMGADGL